MTTLENSSEHASGAKKLGRRQAIPVIHTRGTHYDIGLDIGRTFSGLIHSYVNSYHPLNETYLPLYNTEAGRKVYEETLACVEKQYPGYVREIQGTAEGANVPFHKLFLMHLDDIVPNVANDGAEGNSLPVGCSTIVCNQPGQEILGHNEDALSETLNHWYLVSAHVLEPGCKEEKFTSLSYAGFLPGYTMGYNYHGFVYTINTLSARHLRSGKTQDNSGGRIHCRSATGSLKDAQLPLSAPYVLPNNSVLVLKTKDDLPLSLMFSDEKMSAASGDVVRFSSRPLVFKINWKISAKIARYFITRALLAAENYVQAQQILRNDGFGAAEGFAVNMTFLTQEGDRMFHNAEIGPCEIDGTQSQLSILTVSPGEHTFHCNKYLRLKVPEVDGLIIDSSVKRMEAICKHPPAKSRHDVINILSDQTDHQYRVYQEITPNDYVKTIATGIFDCIERTWSLYIDKPNSTEPILVIPLELRDDQPTIPAMETLEK